MASISPPSAALKTTPLPRLTGDRAAAFLRRPPGEFAPGDALARIHAQAAILAAAAPGAYVPLTKDDNSPWRFDMSQNGKRMTADEFDAWMKAKGIRVATGRPAGSAVSAPPPPPPSGQ